MPAWERAHPNRYIIHNGEINTLKGNKNWVAAREPELYSPVLQGDLAKTLPVINREGSDSAMLDNVVEFLHMNGRSLPRAMSMLVPEPWDHNPALSERRRAWDEYQSMLTEAWDGPAALAFTDGVILGATLDRNGLRPARYYVTKDNRLVLSSEVGVLDVDPANILVSGSLGPGQMLVVDPSRGRVMFDDEVKNELANERPYREWIDSRMIEMPALLEKNAAFEGDAAVDDGIDLTLRQVVHGFHYDDMQEAILPMARTGKTPLASMGMDVPLACLTDKDRRLFDYFNQLFAQVTNPPIDALRESFITSTLLYLGNHGNMLEDARENCRLVKLETPLLQSGNSTRWRISMSRDSRLQRFMPLIVLATERTRCVRRLSACIAKRLLRSNPALTSLSFPIARVRVKFLSLRCWLSQAFTIICFVAVCVPMRTSLSKRVTPSRRTISQRWWVILHRASSRTWLMKASSIFA